MNASPLGPTIRAAIGMGGGCGQSYFTIYAYRQGERVTRLGLAVGKAVGIAVVRNRVKRRLRELFRRRKALVPSGYDLFVRAFQPVLRRPTRLLRPPGAKPWRC